VGDDGYGSAMPESTMDRPINTHEYVFLLTKKERCYYDAEATRVNWSGGSHLLRNVWLINPGNFSDAHFATFPPALVEPCIKAGTSEHGVCPDCGAPWARVVERKAATPGQNPGYNEQCGMRNDGERAGHWTDAKSVTTGWQPTCSCLDHEPIPATVLDPFGGAGTTALVADRLGRDAVLIELNPEYAEMARVRIAADCPMFTDVEVVGDF
jgi:hypothetical protein